MALVPLFVIAPSAVVALIGHLKGPKPVQAPDPAAIAELEVDVVIPAYNEGKNIALCLASLVRQTVKPNSITVIDDGSDDNTADVAEAFAATNNVPIRVIRRRRSIGKTPSLKIQSRTLEGDVEFILDADTILVSEDYIEKVIAQLYRVPGIASACGVIYPLREQDREEVLKFDSLERLQEQHPEIPLTRRLPMFNRIAKEIGNFYRDALYEYMQRFYYVGLQNLFGSIMNPVGCAVAYRREYVKELFDVYEPLMGDNLTSSEDIFAGTAFIAAGYHNTQIQGIYARSDEPEFHRVPRQLVRWSSAWLQTGYYLPEVFTSPFRAFRRYQHRRRNAGVAQQRRIVDGYRQPFGATFTKQLGRPGGWLMFFAVVEKVAFFLVLLILLLIGAWLPLVVTLLAEMFLYTLFLTVFARGHRLEYFLKGVCVAPLRYIFLLGDVITFGRFGVDLATGRRGWRK